MTKYWTVFVTASLATLLALFAPAHVTRADIFKWQYINPANPSLGKQPSTMLCPGGAGASATPGADLSNRNLTMAYLIGANLGAIPIYGGEYGDEIIYYVGSTLTGTNLSQADLTNANLYDAVLTGANLAGAEVRGANLGYTGITAAQLYSTASYQAHDLSGIGLYNNNLTGANLAGQNLTNASFYPATLTGANLSQANLTNAHLNSATLTNANLSQANLTNANFNYASLTGAILTGAEVRGADFYRYDDYGTGGITPAQLSSTASYLAHDLTGIRLAGNNLAGANLAGQNLTNANFSNGTLTGANLSQANFTNANLLGATLTIANLTGAEVRGASFLTISAAQLYSTASYQAHDLSGIGLYSNLAGVNLAGQNLTHASFSYTTVLTGANLSQANLTNASFSSDTDLTGANLSQANLTNANISATLTGANLTGAEVRGASFLTISAAQLYSTASYQAHDLSGIGLYSNLAGVNFVGQNLTNAHFATYTDLTGANLSQANLTNAGFAYTTLSGANLTGAEVRGASFARDDCNYPGSTGITLAQLYSTASYQAHDLSGIGLQGGMLAGVNLASQNLTSADFSGYEVCYEFGCSNVPGADLTGANLSGADLRGANFYLATLDGANTSNLIQSNGHIAGLDLTSGASLVVRDYDAGIPIVVDQHLAMNATGTLRLVFDADPWDSLISFAPGIPVTRGGTLELTFAPEVNLVSQIGRTIDLFDWTGVTSTGTFTISSPYTWNLSKLYTTGEVTLTAVPQLVPGDYNGNGIVGPEDYDIWKSNFGSTTNLAADGNGNHIIDAADYSVWRDHLGQTLIGSAAGSAGALPSQAAIPEPTSLLLLCAGTASVLVGQRARRGPKTHC